MTASGPDFRRDSHPLLHPSYGHPSGRMTPLEVGGVAVDHLSINTKVEGGASRTVIIIVTDPLLVDPEPSKPRRGSTNDLLFRVTSVGIGRHFLCDRAEYRHSTIVYRKCGLRSVWINKEAANSHSS